MFRPVLPHLPHGERVAIHREAHVHAGEGQAVEALGVVLVGRARVLGKERFEGFAGCLLYTSRCV